MHTAVEGRPVPQRPGGSPSERAAARPHPGGQLWVPRAFDGMQEFFAASGEHPPSFARDDSRDPLRGRPRRQRTRERHVARVLGQSAQRVWEDLVAADYADFIHAYRVMLRYT